MKNSVTLSLMIGLGLGFAFAYTSPAFEGDNLLELPEQYFIPRVSEAPHIDGLLQDWDDEGVFAVEVTPETRPPRDHFVNFSNPFEGSADLSARIMLTWDDRHLYVAARVNDDHLRGIAPGTGHDQGPDGWGSDGVMLYLHSFRQSIERPGPHRALALRYTVAEDGGGEVAGFRAHPDKRWKLTPGSHLASVATADGYQLEAAIPWEEIGFEAGLGEPLFIGMMVVDVDPDQPLKQLGWHWSERQLFRLANEPDPAAVGLLSFAHDRFSPQRGAQTVLYHVDALAADVQVEAVRLAGPDGLQRTIEINATVPAGKRGEGFVSFDDIPEVLGTAVVSVDAVVSGSRTVLTSAAFEIVAADRATAEVVTSPAGELVRQSPERTYHHAQEDARRDKIRYHHVENRQDYEPWIFAHIKPKVDALENIIEQRYMGPGGNRNATNYIWRTLVLYRLTGEERYAQLTRMLVESQLRALEQDRVTGIHNRLNSLIWIRHFIWQHDPGTHLAPADAEQRYAAVWASYAASPPDQMFSEWGYHNRVLDRWRDLSLIAHFATVLDMPVDPRIAEYLDWHEQHLIPFGGDSTDNSSGYNWLGILYFMETHVAMGRLDELKENDAFWQVAARLGDYYSPAGALPNWGDTSGWMTGGEHIHHFELFGRLSGDGRHRYTAHRIAEYYYNFMWSNPDQYHGPADRAHNSFALAWLHADDNITPRAPGGASQILYKPGTVRHTTAERQARAGLAATRLGDPVPDKALLKSGNAPLGLWAFVELLDKGDHAGSLPGNIATILAQGAALYAGQGYWDTSQGSNNVLWIEDLEGTGFVAEPMRAEVPVFAEDRALTWLQVRTLRYGQLPITARRDILFVKNGFIVVRDKLEFHGSLKLRLGPAWHSRNLGPQSGEDWFNTYYEKLYHTGLGVGRGVHVWPNPAWDMLIAYAPRTDCVVQVDDRYDENPWRVSPVRMRQSWSGFVRDGDSRTFVTVLLPHPPALEVEPFRERLEFIVDSDDSLLLRVPRYNNARNPLGGNLITLQFHDRAGTLDTDEWSSDAAVAMVESRPDGTLVQALVIDGTSLTANGADLLNAARKLKAGSEFSVDE